MHSSVTYGVLCVCVFVLSSIPLDVVLNKVAHDRVSVVAATRLGNTNVPANRCMLLKM